VSPGSPVLIPRILLIATGALGTGLSAPRVAEAIARGVRAGGLPEPDRCPLGHGDRAESVGALLDGFDFDARLHRARAVVIGDARLREKTLAGSVTFEIATRARQRGVPAYAVTAANELNAFDARILDLQLILMARDVPALVPAGRKLAEVA